MGTLGIAFQTLGVVYGDMGTSPLYVFSDVFSKVPIRSEVDVLGALSLVIYTIAVIPLAKYVFVVLKANDNGEGNASELMFLVEWCLCCFSVYVCVCVFVQEGRLRCIRLFVGMQR